MTFRGGLVYVLRHVWFWPLEFWLRPLDVMDRLEQPKQQIAEIISALLGGAFWGALAGVLVWLWTGEIQAIWILAGAGAGAGAGAFIAVVAALGITLWIWLPSVISFLSIGVGCIFFVFNIWIALSEIKVNIKFPDWAKKTWIIIWLSFLPLIAFAFLLQV